MRLGPATTGSADKWVCQFPQKTKNKTCTNSRPQALFCKLRTRDKTYTNLALPRGRTPQRRTHSRRGGANSGRFGARWLHIWQDQPQSITQKGVQARPLAAPGARTLVFCSISAIFLVANFRGVNSAKHPFCAILLAFSPAVIKALRMYMQEGIGGLVWDTGKCLGPS